MFVVSEGQPVLLLTNYPKQHHHSVNDFQPMHNRQWKAVTVVIYFWPTDQIFCHFNIFFNLNPRVNFVHCSVKLCLTRKIFINYQSKGLCLRHIHYTSGTFFSTVSYVTTQSNEKRAHALLAIANNHYWRSERVILVQQES